MRIKDVYEKSPFGISFEIFPPKTEAGDVALLEGLQRLTARSPDFISCTYGAGGSTQDRTLELCEMIQRDFQIPATAHFTCVGSTIEQLNNWLDAADLRGIQNFMALRGDAPAGSDSFEAVSGGLKYANELVELIRSRFPDVGIGVAGYPEKHPEASTMEFDLDNLVRKVDAGADAIFTQLFYHNENFFRFRDELERRSVSIPVVAGIMPITEFARIKRITAMCGAIIPDGLAGQLEAVQDDAEAQRAIGVDYAIKQCQQLVDEGVRGIHFYVLNKSEACERILDAVQIPRSV
ncbi:5,10-methylenetetrahydrofolate reductase [Thalassoglobus neptunius]|uniref:Methylenetetrahydrofolate reductase n=1 Tax=Thalassoglobus neptunius TaxID=1938619 RepID=A0A5C5X6F8_9PLAN|nr:methylenetetrahydrofolate reductase [NAD(P)H] [Thalassoglobus neptunius]TWT58520.1 5,10-methylenetetrahydrofolate reductase [Thalassoglobus neptunius]